MIRCNEELSESNALSVCRIRELKVHLVQDLAVASGQRLIESALLKTDLQATIGLPVSFDTRFTANL